jgi:hypothetical protein
MAANDNHHSDIISSSALYPARWQSDRRAQSRADYFLVDFIVRPIFPGFLGSVFFFATRCCGGLFATTVAACSKRAHASGCNSRLEVSPLESFAMQPLSRVNPKASVTWGDSEMMPKHTYVARRIAECTSEWADIETMLGMLLGFLLGTDSKAAMAMFSAVESSAAQRQMILAAAGAKLPSEHVDVLSVLFSAVVTPVMKERNKLVHWVWAYSPEVPDCLLITKPDHKMVLHFQAVHVGRARAPEVPFDPSEIFVVTEDDLIRLAKRLRKAKDYVTRFMATIWMENSREVRAEYLQKLSSEPQIHEALMRLRGDQKKTP